MTTVNHAGGLRRSAALAALLLSLFTAGCGEPPPQYKGVDLSVVPGGGDFELTAHSGERFRLADQRGRLVLIFFGYSHCPDICSPALTRLALLMQDLGKQAEQVQVLFITVDPQRDTVAQLADFVPRFDPRFVGLTGSDQEITAVAAQYHSAYERVPGKTGMFAHSGNVYVVDRQGRLRLAFRDAMALPDMRHDLSLLLAE